MLDFIHFVFVFHGNHVETVPWFHGDKAGDLVPRPEMIDHIGKMQIGQSIGIVRQKGVLSFQIFFDGGKSFSMLEFKPVSAKVMVQSLMSRFSLGFLTPSTTQNHSRHIHCSSGSSS